MLSELQPRKILFHLFQISSKGEMELSAGAVQSHYSVLIHHSHCSTKATVEREVQQHVFSWESKLLQGKFDFLEFLQGNS